MDAVPPDVVSPFTTAAEEAPSLSSPVADDMRSVLQGLKGGVNLDVDRRLGAALHDAIRTFGTVTSWKALVESMDAVRMRSFMVDVGAWGEVRGEATFVYLPIYLGTA
jgi:hypothetical protein